MNPDPPRPFPQLSPAAFQHLDDQKASRALQQTPGFPSLVKFINGEVTEKAIRLHHLSSCIRVSQSQAPQLYQQFLRAADTLAVSELPELYVAPGPELNAYAMGIRRTTVVLTAPLVSLLSPEELLAVIGHELGHIKCEHMINKTVAYLVAVLGAQAISTLIPAVGGLLVAGISASLGHWSRKAEISCDRAALLTVQDPVVVASLLAKLGGWPEKLGAIDFESLREQGREYDNLDEDTTSAFLKVQETLQSGAYVSHPRPIQRIRHILQWAQTEQYQAILRGDYPRLDAAVARRCQVCGKSQFSGDQFCPHCGSEQTLLQQSGPSCAKCSRPVQEPRPKFCGGCGANLTEPGAISG